MTVESGITLCRTLASAKPKSATASVKKAATRLGTTADAAQSALAIRQKELAKVSDDDARSTDQAGDGSWGALRMRLEAYSVLPPLKYPDATIAAELLAALFGPDGLSFLKLTYAEQWSTADTILQRIDSDNLTPDIDRVAGPEFLAHVRDIHTTYGAMVQSLLLREQSTNVNLNEHVRAMGRAIVDYATKILATVEDDDDESITAARDALRPLDTYREAAARRNSSKVSSTPETPAEPRGAGSGT